MSDTNVRYIHLFDKTNAKGGVTVAYEPVLTDGKGSPQGRFARVAVSYCRKDEMYNRKLGVKLTTKSLKKKRFILLPVYDYDNPTRFLISIFQ